MAAVQGRPAPGRMAGGGRRAHPGRPRVVTSSPTSSSGISSSRWSGRWRRAATAGSSTASARRPELDCCGRPGLKCRCWTTRATRTARARLTSAGLGYGLYPAPAGSREAGGRVEPGADRRAGEHVEHWLNGRKVVEYELGGPDWEAKVKASKFKRVAALRAASGGSHRPAGPRRLGRLPQHQDQDAAMTATRATALRHDVPAVLHLGRLVRHAWARTSAQTLHFDGAADRAGVRRDRHRRA